MSVEFASKSAQRRAEELGLEEGHFEGREPSSDRGFTSADVKAVADSAGPVGVPDRDESWTTDQWKGQPLFRCLRDGCKYSTLDLPAMQAHAEAH